MIYVSRWHHLFCVDSRAWSGLLISHTHKKNSTHFFTARTDCKFTIKELISSRTFQEYNKMLPDTVVTFSLWIQYKITFLIYIIMKEHEKIMIFIRNFVNSNTFRMHWKELNCILPVLNKWNSTLGTKINRIYNSTCWTSRCWASTCWTSRN